MGLSTRFSKNRGSLATTPWRKRGTGGVYFGHNNDVWAYFELPLRPLQWEDAQERLDAAAPLNNLITELGATTVDVAGGMKMLAANRHVHIFAATYDRYVAIPEEATDPHKRFLGQVLPEVEPAKALLVGVKLWPSWKRKLSRGTSGGGSMVEQAKKAFSRTEEDDFDPFTADYAEVSDILRRNGGRVPKREALAQLESWFNLGRGPDTVVLASPDKITVPGAGAYEISALHEFTEPILHAPADQWLLDAMTHPDPAVVISMRGTLTPPTVIRSQLRSAQRKLRAAEEEEARTGDISRDELMEKSAFAKDLENTVRAAQHAWIADFSVLAARDVTVESEYNDSYIDALRTRYGIEMRPLEHRQVQALAEMSPCATTSPNPFHQTVNPALVAYSGLPAFSHIGDKTGMWLGSVDPDYTNVFVDPFGAPNNNKPPTMAIFGDPGSGKTFAAQLLSGQAALGGVQTIMINPKGFQSLNPFVEWARSQGIEATRVSMQAMESEGGAFDPFRFAEPEAAAEILARHITSVIGQHAGGLRLEQEVELAAALKEGAQNGARCAAEAMAYVTDQRTVDLVNRLVRASTLFRLAFGTEPKPMFTTARGLTLIEFDRDLGLPAPGKPDAQHEREERIAVGAMRLVTRASLEILAASQGGVLVVDEAHHFLGSTEGRASLERIGREGRSLNLLPIFLTQRVSDLLDADMENYLSRVMVMKLTDRTQAAAALRLCGLEPTSERVEFLRDAGPQQPSKETAGRGALGFFRDLEDRHSVVMIGPVPEHVRLAFSTNPEDAKKRQETDPTTPATPGQSKEQPHR